MASCRFTVAVHALAVLAHRHGEDVTSEYLARSINTNAVIVRRLLCDLRHAGLVVTQKGAGGGTSLSRQPQEISLRQVYEAVECGPSFSLPAQPPNPACAIGQRMLAVLPRLVEQAHEAVAGALGAYTVADLVADIPKASTEQR